jgi:hypothetical protein
MGQCIASTDIVIDEFDGIEVVVSRDAYYLDRSVKVQAKQLANELLGVTGFLRKTFNLPEQLRIRIAKTKGRSNRGSYSHGFKTVMIDPRESKKSLYQTVMHELVHAEQYHTGRLVHDVVVNNNGNVRWINEWEGKPITSKGATYNSYRNLPHEKEAFARQETLGKKLAKAISSNSLEASSKRILRKKAA